MKNLKKYNVSLLDSSEINSINGGGIGRWLAQGIRAIERGVYYAFNHQYNHVQKMMNR